MHTKRRSCKDESRDQSAVSTSPGTRKIARKPSRTGREA